VINSEVLRKAEKPQNQEPPYTKLLPLESLTGHTQYQLGAEGRGPRWQLHLIPSFHKLPTPHKVAFGLRPEKLYGRQRIGS
jgi:hypothetical protein